MQEIVCSGGTLPPQVGRATADGGAGQGRVMIRIRHARCRGHVQHQGSGRVVRGAGSSQGVLDDQRAS